MGSFAPQWKRSVVKKSSAIAALATLTLLASACSNGATSTDGDGAPGECTAEDSEVSFGVHAEVRGFDVVQGGTVGVAGGAERAAVFDSLMQYDPDAGDFVPRMAESFEPSSDYTQWTLKLRDGMTFASGAPVTTEAVEFSVDRHGADDTASLYKAQMDLIESMVVNGPLEMVFHLRVPQGDFPSVFASAPGMLADPAVFQQKGAEAFAMDPGEGAAGPYQVQSYTPGEEVVLTRRDDYWGEGEFCIDTLRFVSVENEEARRDAFLNGELDMAFFNSPAVVEEVREQTPDIHTEVSWGSSTVLINHGTSGVDRPGSDLRVRKAIAHALDPRLIDERATGGTGIASSALVTDRSALWSEGLEGPAYDPDLAASLLAEAKADGYDGQITLSCDNAPSKVEWAVAVEGMLERVGFEVELDNSRSITDHRELFFTGNYDLTCFAMNVDETQPWATFQTTLGQDPVAQARVGYRSDSMADAMDELLAAGSAESRRNALARMQDVWNDEIPAVITGHGERGVAWGENVEGLRFGHTAIVLFDDALVRG
jgi:peptide/nickel transport system substrate-binding protein